MSHRLTGPLGFGKADQTGTSMGVPDRYSIGACRNVSGQIFHCGTHDNQWRVYDGIGRQ